MQLGEKLVIEEVEYQMHDPGFTTTDSVTFTDADMMQQYDSIQAAATEKIPYVGDKAGATYMLHKKEPLISFSLKLIDVLFPSWSLFPCY